MSEVCGEVGVRRMGVWTIGRVDVQGSGWGIELESMIVLCCIVPQGCGILVWEGGSSVFT